MAYSLGSQSGPIPDNAQCQPKCFEMFGAQERIRTSTTLRPLDPESSASASSATWALPVVRRGEFIVLAAQGFVNASHPGEVSAVRLAA
jgi:hypothetical protein